MPAVPGATAGNINYPLFGQRLTQGVKNQMCYYLCLGAKRRRPVFFCFPPTHPAKREKERETTYHTGYISLAERATQRVQRGGFGEDSPPPAVSCGSWTKAQHQRGGYKRARREQKASALARAHLMEKSIGSCFRVISGKSGILLDRRKPKRIKPIYWGFIPQ